MIVTDERVARFISERLGAALCPPYTLMGVERDGRIVGGVLFNCFEGSNIDVTVAGEGWGRDFIKAVGDYAFGQLGCLRISVKTAQPQVLDYARRLGGEVEGCKPDYFGRGRSAHLVGILRDNWRFAISDAIERG